MPNLGGGNSYKPEDAFWLGSQLAENFRTEARFHEVFESDLPATISQSISYINLPVTRHGKNTFPRVRGERQVRPTSDTSSDLDFEIG